MFNLSAHKRFNLPKCRLGVHLCFHTCCRYH